MAASIPCWMVGWPAAGVHDTSMASFGTQMTVPPTDLAANNAHPRRTLVHRRRDALKHSTMGTDDRVGGFRPDERSASQRAQDGITDLLVCGPQATQVPIPAYVPALPTREVSCQSH